MHISSKTKVEYTFRERSFNQFLLTPEARQRIILLARHSTRPGYFLKASEMFIPICEAVTTHKAKISQGAKVLLVLDKRRCWPNMNNQLLLEAKDFIHIRTEEPIEVIGNKCKGQLIEIKKRGY